MTGHSLKPVGEWLGESFGQLRGRWVTLSALFVFGFFVLLLAVVMVYGLGSSPIPARRSTCWRSPGGPSPS